MDKERDKSTINASIMWKHIVLAFEVIRDWLVWDVGNCRMLGLG